MRGLIVGACMLAVGGVAGAAEFCPPQGCPEPAVQTPAAYCPPPQPVVQRTRCVPEQRVVRVPRGRWVTERRIVPCQRTVYVNEPYTTRVARYETRPEMRMRQVTRTVREYETRVVNETVYENVCDPVTGVTRRCPRVVSRTMSTPVSRRVCVNEPYTVNVRHRVMVPVTRTRRVARTVPSTREVTERRWVTDMVPETVTVMRPVVETCAVPSTGAV